MCVCAHMCAVLLSLSYFLLKLITPLWILVLFSAFPALGGALGPLGCVVPLGLGLRGGERERGAWTQRCCLPVLPISCSFAWDQVWRQL